MPANVLALSGVVFLACALGAAGAWAQGASVDRGNGFVEHGVAAPVSRARGIAATLDGKGRPVVLAWLADHRGCYEMLVVDAATGNSAEYPLPFDTWDSPFAVLLSSGNKFYSLFGNRFVEFDPAARAFTFVGKADDRVAMSMAETPDGTVWAATYPNSHLFSFDPESRKLVGYGSINHEKWPQYQRYMAIDRSGWVYVGIGNVRSHLIAFNPKTREVRPIAKDDERRPGTGVVWLGTDGKVYGRPGGKASWYVLFEGRATPIEKPPVAAAPTKSGSQETVIRDFPNAWRIHAIDIPDKHMEIFDTKSRDLKRLSFDYSSEGSHIMSLILGPEGKVHGSTGHPLRFFSYDPERDSFTYPGLQDLNGHLNALAVQRGHIFGALYGGGILYEYDPARPWDDMAKKAPNPRRVAAGSKVIGRPHALIAHPDGRTLIMTGTPGYGLTGGGMLIYDRRGHAREGGGTVYHGFRRPQSGLAQGDHSRSAQHQRHRPRSRWAGLRPGGRSDILRVRSGRAEAGPSGEDHRIREPRGGASAEDHARRSRWKDLRLFRAGHRAHPPGLIQARAPGEAPRHDQRGHSVAAGPALLHPRLPALELARAGTGVSQRDAGSGDALRPAVEKSFG